MSPTAPPGGRNTPARLRLGVRGRLITLATTLVLLGAASVAVAIVGLSSAGSKSKSSQQNFNAFRAERDAYEGWLTDDDQSNMVAALAASGDRAQESLLKATAAQVVQGHQQALTNLTALAHNAPSASIRANAQRLLSDLTKYNAFTDKVLADALAWKGLPAVQEAAIFNANISNQTQADFNATGAPITKRAQTITNSVASTVTSSETLVAIIAAVAALLAALITVLVIRSITRPLAETTAAAERLAGGDVDVQLSVTGDDEIGRMARAFSASIAYLQNMAGKAREIAQGNLAVEIEPQSERDALGVAFLEMRDRIASMVGEIAGTATTVGAASEQMAHSGVQAGTAVAEIADSVGGVAAGAEEQVRALTDARAITEQVTRSSQDSAAEAEQTAAAVRETRDLARQGSDVVTRATDAMRAVQSSSSEISGTIRELGSMSDQIGGIVDTITAIAEQTNLLALNAAIEAARAGEQGRGFAVVAEEVRKLAEESQRAAGTIGSLIAQIQSGTGRAVEVVADGSERAEQGARTVQEASEVFARIDAGVENMSERVERISAAVAEIAAAGGRVQASLDQVLTVAENCSASAEEVSATTQETSAATQQIAASASELTKTAEQLQQLVGQFTLDR